MATLKKKMARLRRRIWQAVANKPAKAPKPVTPPLMPLAKAEALALRKFNLGLAELKRHPKLKRETSYYRIAERLLSRNKLVNALAANALIRDKSAAVHAQRAVILHSLGHMPQMLESATKANELDPLIERSVRLLTSFAPERLATTRQMERLIYTSPEPGETAARASNAMFRTGRTAETMRAFKRILERVDMTPLQRDQVTYHAGVTAEVASKRIALRYFREPSPEGSKWAERKAIGISRCLLSLGKLDAAREVLPPTPNYCAARLEVNLASGRIGEAYAEYLLRPQAKRLVDAFPNFMQSGPRQLIIPEGGPGDEIRFTSLLKESGATVATCEPRLTSLLTRSFPDVEFIPVTRPRYEFRSADHDNRKTVPSLALATFMDDRAVAAAREADGVICYQDLVSRLRPDRSAFPGTPYLIADPERVDRWRRLMAKDRPNIALSWRSMLFTIQRSQHYLLAEQLAPLKALNAKFWLFQPGMRVEEFMLLHDLLGAEIPPLLDPRDDFEGQAAFLSCMDAVVSPYSTPAELAGALGVPTFMMAFTPNTQWRRNPDGSDVWHGSGRVICGTSATMADQIAEALAVTLQSWSAPEPDKAPHAFAATPRSEPGPAAPQPSFSYRDQRDYAEGLILMESAYMPE